MEHINWKENQYENVGRKIMDVFDATDDMTLIEAVGVLEVLKKDLLNSIGEDIDDSE